MKAYPKRQFYKNLSKFNGGSIKQAVKERDCNYKKCLMNKSAENRNLYKQKRNIEERVMRDEKIKYETKIDASQGNNIRILGVLRTLILF